MSLKFILKNIDLYGDGLKIEEIIKYSQILNGYTFNPTLFRQLKVLNYLNFSKEILNFTKKKPVSLEVISDEPNKIIYEAEKLSSLSKDIYVKIPIVFSNGSSTKKIIKHLVQKKIKLNITAIFTLDQIKNIITEIKDSETILSFFAGRVYDAGQDASAMGCKISKYVKKNSSCKLLWASPRMVFDIKTAYDSNFDIITLPKSLIEKIPLFGKDLNLFSKETVEMFVKDAKKARFKI